MNNELKPCPFCGGEAILNNIEPHTHQLMFNGHPIMPDHPGSWTIECCDVGMIKDTREEVIAAWNRRALDAAPAEQTTQEPKRGLPAYVTQGFSRSEWHDKAWALYHAKTFGDTQLSKVNMHTIRTVFNATFDALKSESKPADLLGNVQSSNSNLLDKPAPTMSQFASRADYDAAVAHLTAKMQQMPPEFVQVLSDNLESLYSRSAEQPAQAPDTRTVAQIIGQTYISPGITIAHELMRLKAYDAAAQAPQTGAEDVKDLAQARRLITQLRAALAAQPASHDLLGNEQSSKSGLLDKPAKGAAE